MAERHELDTSLKLFIVLSRAFRALNDKANQSIQSFNLNPTEFAVLELLYHKGEQPLQQIGGKILLASGSITYVVDKLENKGLLARKACPKDRRVTYAQITDEGKQLLNEIFPKHEQHIHTLVDGLTQQEKEQAIQLMKKLGLNAQQKD
ncbi:MAG: MarR family transcriptional regulator [Bacillota bacterium]|uniref:MarR family winged helix-turn-helix transcriptional regulator n=1 Tax=Bacillus sp. RO2 TaxID=2723913 RepID=UPI00145F7CC3|nr:MarR family transcriptional regulator [Bacillus sp. RO2]MEA3321890.1 MarR family transcriptional regulator [Bacillota bacterium]NMH73130.1 MarR family transcriptional regulator [Bacillus sp. RO2]